MTWRDDLASARGDIHAHFAVDALYFPTAATPEEEAVSCTVRVHDIAETQGDVNGLGFAERAVSVPRIVFLASEIPSPKSKAVVQLVADGRRYKIDTVLPQHGITIPCEAAPMQGA